MEDRTRRVRTGRGVSLDVTTARERARRAAPLVDQVPAFSPSRSRDSESIRRLRKLVEERERGVSRQVEEEPPWPVRYVDSTRNISVDSGLDLVMDLRSQKQAARRLRQLRALNPLELLLKARTSLKLGLAGGALEQVVVGRDTILQLEVTSRMVRSMRAAKVIQAKGGWSSITSRERLGGGGKRGGLAQGRDTGSPGEEGGGTAHLTTLNGPPSPDHPHQEAVAIYDQLAEKSVGPNGREASLQVREALADLQALLAKAELHSASGEHETALVLYSRWHTV